MSSMHKSLKEGQLLWTPTAERVEAAEITRFMRWLASERGLEFTDYESLRQWSVQDLSGFWSAFWAFYDIRASRPATQVLASPEMPGAKWFPGARLNFAEHALRHLPHLGDDAPALWFASEQKPLQSLSGAELRRQVAKVAAALREMGVEPGDRVVAFMPNIPETIIACLATLSLGAIWSSCATDFGSATVLDRFRQIEPKVIFAVDGYCYGGKTFDRSEVAGRIIAGLPSLQNVIWLRYLDADGAAPVEDALEWQQLLDDPAEHDLTFAQLPFDHPLWIVYSSGTTGLPKAIVHGHGGVLLELHKMLGLHCDLKAGDRMFFYSSSGWIMWNILMSSLLVGAQPVLYDGHPAAPDPDILWRLAAESKATLFGGSPAYLAMMQKAGVVPRDRYDYPAMRGMLLSGSPVTPESMQWLYQNVKSDLWVTSQSGGTDVASAFVNGSCILPVYAGEIQARSLGVDVQAWNEAGEPVIDEVGELVVTRPMPSMPLYFWNDPENRRYLDAYFDIWPRVWRHGDFFELNARGGCFIRGRSDSTLNRHGVRIGTAEIYRCIETLEEVEDSLVVNLDLPDGGFLMPLFLKLAPGQILNEALQARIVTALKQQCSPRHVPDEMHVVEEIPYTLTGKKLEVPVRKILMGGDVGKSVSRDAMQNPDAIREYISLAAELKARGSQT